MIKRIAPQDFSIRPFKAYKLWNLNQASNGIRVYRGIEDTNTYFNSASVSRDVYGIPKRSIFDSTNQLYYKNQTNFKMIGQKGRYEENIRTIHNFCNVISIPGIYFGEEIKPETVQLVDSTTGRTYSDDGKGNLIDNATSTQVGNVIYPHGLIIGTHTGSAYSESFAGDFDLQFRASTTIYETEIFLEVNEGEFNVSTNPTAYIADTGSRWNGFIRKKGWYDVPGQGEIYYDLNYTSSYNPNVYGGFSDYDYSSSLDPTGSFLAPYITTIGLMNDTGDIVAVAKLAKPIKSLPDFPVNFIVRLDM